MSLKCGALVKFQNLIILTVGGGNFENNVNIDLIRAINSEKKIKAKILGYNKRSS